MANPSKAKGTTYETKVTRTVNDWAGDTVCERVVLHGSRDHGDLRMRARGLQLTIECKWREKYPCDADEHDFREQTDAEAANAGTDGGVLVINRYRQGVERHEAWMHVGTAMRLCGARNVPEPSEHDWVCARLADFLWLCYGPPAWEDRRNKQ